MSEHDLPPGSVNVEDDPPETPPSAPPAAVPDAPPAPVAAAPAPEPELPESDPDPRVNGLLHALKAERQKARTLADKAARAEALEQEVAQARPYVDFLRANPAVMQPRPETPPPAPEPTADPDALEAAKLMDFYKADGTPDVERGARYLALQDRRAHAAAQHVVQPIQTLTYEQQAQINVQRIAAVKDAQGRSASPEAVQAATRLMGAKDLADPQVASVIAALALGLDRMQPAAPAPPPNPPLVTEAPGGPPRGQVTLSPLQQRIATNRGVTATQFAEHMKGFQAGRPTILESD